MQIHPLHTIGSRISLFLCDEIKQISETNDKSHQGNKFLY